MNLWLPLGLTLEPCLRVPYLAGAARLDCGDVPAAASILASAPDPARPRFFVRGVAVGAPCAGSRMGGRAHPAAPDEGQDRCLDRAPAAGRDPGRVRRPGAAPAPAEISRSLDARARLLAGRARRARVRQGGEPRRDRVHLRPDAPEALAIVLVPRLYERVVAWLAWAHELVDPIKRRLKQSRMFSPKRASRTLRLLLRIRRRMQAPRVATCCLVGLSAGPVRAGAPSAGRTSRFR